MRSSRSKFKRGNAEGAREGGTGEPDWKRGGEFDVVK